MKHSYHKKRGHTIDLKGDLILVGKYNCAVQLTPNVRKAKEKVNFKNGFFLGYSTFKSKLRVLWEVVKFLF